MSESSKKVRVSPYPLRSCRTKEQKASESDVIKTKWEDVRCVICMEPPHNAVLLKCSSSSSGCHPYMCDTSFRHSNCYKLFKRTNGKKRPNPKTLQCPLCRGEISETTKVITTGRRFMNAKTKSCPVEDCEFSGTYAQLNKHMKSEHHGVIPLKVDSQRQFRWEMMESHDEFVQVLTAAEIHNPLPIRMIFNGTMFTLIGSTYVPVQFQP